RRLATATGHANAAPSGVALDDDDLQQIDTSGFDSESDEGRVRSVRVRSWASPGGRGSVATNSPVGVGFDTVVVLLGRAEHPDLHSTGVMHRRRGRRGQGDP